MVTNLPKFTVKVKLTAYCSLRSKCGDPNRCLISTAVAMYLRQLDPYASGHYVRTDGSGTRFTYKGWRYAIAPTDESLEVLLAFDNNRKLLPKYDGKTFTWKAIGIRPKTVRTDQARQNENRRKHIQKHGKDSCHRRSYPKMLIRIDGMAQLVDPTTSQAKRILNLRKMWME